MKVLAITLYKYIPSTTSTTETQPIKLSSATKLDSFPWLQRSVIAQHIQFASRTVTQRTPPGQRQTVQLDDNPFVVHVHVRLDGLAGTVVADKEYPARVAFTFLSKAMSDYEQQQPHWKNLTIDQSNEPAALTAELTKFQDPAEADKLTKIQQNLDEITGIMHKNIEEVLKRGENLDTLMDKSDDLSSASKTFYKQAKKTNQCCQYY